MNTNSIKSFAKSARLILLEGVLQRLKYWGFDENGKNSLELETTVGGYIIKGRDFGIFTDTSVPSKWKALKTRLKDKQAVQDVVEEASYTWFNRLMAIKILEVNGYLEPTLSFTEGMRTPLIVQNAKKGIHSLRSQADKDLLLEYLREDKEEQAFGLLIVDLCNRNKLLHDIFGRIDDYTEILLPQNLLQRDGLLDLINSDAISLEDYKEVEIIGWLYQFYISDKKDEVFAGFKKNKKARAADIPAATQIFTPKWIVKYMVENTVGKIYLDYEPDSQLRSQMKYLVENDSDKNINNLPLTINNLSELTLIDPACGSGHILVTGFDLLFKMYREEGYTAKQAVEHILTHNLFGLDIDDRAMQLARFAVLLKAAEYYPEVLTPNPSVPIPKIYSFPEASHFTGEELQNFLGHDGYRFTAELKEALQLLNQGKNIGSALKLELSEEAQSHIKKRYDDWLQKNKHAGLDIEQSSIWNRLQPFLDVLLILTKKYAAVVANPPYMGQKSMNAELKDYVNTHYPLTKSDLFAVFMEVCLNLNVKKGLMGMINQHSWMFLSSYEKLREEILNNYSIMNMLHLGPRTFEELSGEVVQSTAFVFENGNDIQEGTYFRLVDYRNNAEKESQFLARNNRYPNIPKVNFSKIPGSPIAYWLTGRYFEIFDQFSVFEEYGDAKQGLATGDNDSFIRHWNEVNFKAIGFGIKEIRDALKSSFKYFPHNKGGQNRKWYGNNDFVIKFDTQAYNILINQGNRLPSKEYYFLESSEWSRIGGNYLGVRFSGFGSIFDGASATMFSSNYLKYFTALLNSKVAIRLLQVLSPSLTFQVGDVRRIPIILDKVIEVETLFELSLETTRKDWDSRETSWDFEKSPLLQGVSCQGLGMSRDQGTGIRDENDLSLSPHPSSLKEAYELWQEEVTKDFFQLHANEEELNRIFIDIYGLQEELTPEVSLKDITILQEELDREELGIREQELGDLSLVPRPLSLELPIKKDVVISQFISYLIGVMMGRYRLDKPGLNIAHPNPTEEETGEYFVIRDKGLGADAQQAIFKCICDEYKEFSRSTGLAKIHGSSNRNLSSNSSISERGNVRVEQSAKTGSGIDTEQHSGGPSERNEGISSLSEDSQGLTGGGGNTIGDSSTSELSGERIDATNPGEDNRNFQNAEWIKQEAKQLIANPKSLIPIKIDEDGILPLMGEDCAFPDDALVRIKDLVLTIWGEDSLTENINFIHEALGMDLHKWLTEKFWRYHTRMYKKKPIYWLFSSNVKKPNNAAFKVLVYMHRMDKYTVQKIQRNYLHPHQEYIKREIEKLVENEENLSKQEMKRLEQLRNWELECRDYNEVLKQLAVQEIEFDLDDGVSVNYAKFEGAVAKI